MKEEFPTIYMIAIVILLQFSTSYMCEKAFLFKKYQEQRQKPPPLDCE